MFPACPVDMLLTLWSKTWRLPVGNSYNRLISFLALSVYVLVLNHDRPASASRQDGYSIGQDGKCVRQEHRDPGGQSQSLNTELWRVSEISNLFDILPIHHDKLGNHNQLCKHCF